tara:strand:- start:522 stop:785 length:264 start_codon:yes stop_codon:yes gene_type:complete
MSNKFEKKALKQVNMINEGLLFGILKFFMKSKTKKAMRKLGRNKDFKAAVADLHYHAEKVKEMTSDFEKKHGMSLDDWSKNRRKYHR